MAPPDSDPQADLRARLAASARLDTLTELCPAWHQATLGVERATLVDTLADLFVHIDGVRSAIPEDAGRWAPQPCNGHPPCLCNQIATTFDGPVVRQ